MSGDIADSLRARHYTDSPPLRRNLLAGSLQLLFWLFSHPTAWRHYIHRLDPALSPGFCLAELTGRQWRRPEFWRLLFQLYLAWPLVAGLLLAAALRILRLPGDSLLIGLMVGVAVGSIASLIVSLVGSLVVGTAVGTAVTLAVGIAAALLFNAAGGLAMQTPEWSFNLVAGTVLGLAGGLAGGLAYGIAEGITGRMRALERTVPLLRQVSGVIIGVLIGVVGGYLTSLISGQLILGLAVGVPLALALGWRTRSWLRGVIGGVLGGLGGSLVGGLAGSVPLGSVVALLGGMTLLVALFGAPYVLAERIAGPGAGALAGAIGAGGGLFLFVAPVEAYQPFLLFTLAGVLLGLVLAWWRPVVAYPFLMAWNILLLRLDERRLRIGRFPLLRWHSAFWDEFQRLALVNLDQHLLLVLSWRPEEGEVALDYLSTGLQRWAAQEAQIELDVRQLARCTDVQAISEAHQELGAGELTGPISALLRSFSRVSQDVAAALNQESAYNQRLALSAVEDRLDGLLRELTRSDEAYADRFRPVAADWRQVIADQVQKLAAEAELRQEIDSPYIIGVPLTQQQEIFIGRAEISARIEQLLLDRRQPPLLLYGQRRVGKTSLLHNLGRLLPSTILPLFVDLQGPASRAQDDAGFLYNVARGISRSARRQRNFSLPPLKREALAADPFTVFEEWLDQVEQSLKGQMALLMLDEFEVLDRSLAQSRFDQEAVLGMLRHLIQHRSRFKVLLSGSHTLDEFQRWSSYLINVQVIHIGYLTPAEARQLIEAPAEGFTLRYEPAASERVLALTRGHPFLVQLLCAEVVALKNEQPPAVRRLATLEDVETAVSPALSHGSFFFADIEQNQVDDVGLAVLQLLARNGEGEATPRQALVDYVPSLMALEETLVKLQQRELIESQNGGYRFQVELVRRWFAKRP